MLLVAALAQGSTMVDISQNAKGEYMSVELGNEENVVLGSEIEQLKLSEQENQAFDEIVDQFEPTSESDDWAEISARGKQPPADGAEWAGGTVR